MKYQRLIISAIALLLTASTPAFADLIYVTNIVVSGTGLGAVNTLVTVHDPGGPGNQNGTESGCINQDGTFGPCLNDYIEGGDNTAINNVLSFTNDTSYAAVVNISETGQDKEVTLTHLYLTFKGIGGEHTAFWEGGNIELTQGTGTGLGGSGFTFKLDDDQFAIVSGLGPSVTVSGGVQFLNGTTDDGNDTLHILQLEGNVPLEPIPEPTSLLLLGTGLGALGLVAYRRRKN